MAPKKTNASSSKSASALSQNQQLAINPSLGTSSGSNSPVPSPMSGTSNSTSHFQGNTLVPPMTMSPEEVNRQYVEMLIEMGVPENIQRKQINTKTTEEKYRYGSHHLFLLIPIDCIDNIDVFVFLKLRNIMVVMMHQYFS